MNESKYAPFCKSLLIDLNADSVVIIVLGGDLGHGAARAEQAGPPAEVAAMRATMVKALRMLADDIEKGTTQPDQDWARRGSS